MSSAPRESHRCARNERCADREKLEETPPVCDECECHGHGLDYPCSVEGGCGHLHVAKKRWAGAQLNTEQGLCEMCTTHLGQAARHLIGDYVELTTLLGMSGGVSDTDRISFSRDLPIPLRLAVKTVQEAIVEETSTWLPALTESLGMDWYSTTEERLIRAQVRVHRASRILANAVSYLLTLPPQEVQAWDGNGLPLWDDVFDCQDVIQLDGIDAGLRLLRLHELTKIVAGRTELTHHLYATCPQCGRRALVRYDGTTDVECRGCHGTWPEEEIQLHTLVLAHGHKQRIDTCEACDKNGRLPDRKQCAHGASVPA